VFPEEAIFRIDHYLGKEAIMNLLYFRLRELVPRAAVVPAITSRACR